MPREIEPSLVEKAFILDSLQENLRLDGRPLDQYRPIELTFGSQYGEARVSLGKTRVFVKVSAEVTVPYPEHPLDGIFIIAMELSPIISPSFEVNRPSETEVLLSRLLERTIRRSGALNTEALCLVAGAKCWAVRADVHVLSHDGNLVDASGLAVVAALRHFRMPDSSLAGEVLTVYTPAERAPVPLPWLHSPFCVTSRFCQRGASEEGAEMGVVVIVDATLAEEQVCAATCTISMNRHGEIYQVAKLGGSPVDAVQLLGCARTALTHVNEFARLVDGKLAEDAKRRDHGGLMAELRAENDR